MSYHFREGFTPNHFCSDGFSQSKFTLACALQKTRLIEHTSDRLRPSIERIFGEISEFFLSI